MEIFWIDEAKSQNSLGITGAVSYRVKRSRAVQLVRITTLKRQHL